MSPNQIKLVFLGLSLFASQAFAGYSNPAAPTLVGSPDDRACSVFMVDGSNGTDSHQWYGIPMSSPGYKEMVDILMAAKNHGKRIQFTLGTGSPCGGDASVLPVTGLILN